MLEIIFILIIIILLELSFIFWQRKRWIKKFEKLRQRFAYYLDLLDRENQRLNKKEDSKSRKDYKNLL